MAKTLMNKGSNMETYDDYDSFHDWKEETELLVSNYKPESDKTKWKHVICSKCGNKLFEVIYTDAYETSAKCSKCGLFEVVHSG